MNSQIEDKHLRRLAALPTPAPDAEARRRAVEAALSAFDAAQQTENSPVAAQGGGRKGRLRSIVPDFIRNWTMDTRLSFGLGTAAIALLLLPLGYQLYTTTAFSPLRPAPVATSAPDPAPAPAPVDVAQAQPVLSVAPAAAPTDLARTEAAVPEAQAKAVAEAVGEARDGADLAPRMPAAGLPREPEMLSAVPAPSPAPTPPAASSRLGDGNGGVITTQRGVSVSSGATGNAAQAAPLARFGGAAPTAPSGGSASMPAPRAMPGIAAPESGRDTFQSFAESQVKSVVQEPVSTFSIDVDTASYSYVRRALDAGWVPPAEAIRVEEMINYFPYDYPAPETTETPVRTSIAVFPTPWNNRTQLLHIGIKGYEPPAGERKAVNLTFLIDTSGSMEANDKLPLLKRALSLLVNQLGGGDTVSIVAYAGSAGVVLAPTKANEKTKILSALENLAAGGSTAGAEGIELAYRLAEENKLSDGVNRVILATDGDFNVGIADPDQLKAFIKTKRDGGVTLSVLGFGQGNLDDATMQALAQNGNGTASYIDSLREAQKVLVEEGGGTLPSIAGDVKIQVEFNPNSISEYRLIGYETRALNREDFNNDRVDAGDIQAGHQVTAIYELTPKGSGAERIDPLRYGPPETPAVAVAEPSDELAFVKLRYKRPGESESQLIEIPVGPAFVLPSVEAASADMRFAAAVAAFGQKLRNSDFGTMDFPAIAALARGARGDDNSGYRAEFVALVGLADALLP